VTRENVEQQAPKTPFHRQPDAKPQPAYVAGDGWCRLNAAIKAEQPFATLAAGGAVRPRLLGSL
jgi:hypothetical protein